MQEKRNKRTLSRNYKDIIIMSLGYIGFVLSLLLLWNLVNPQMRIWQAFAIYAIGILYCQRKMNIYQGIFPILINYNKIMNLKQKV